jgi:hypothetical protein
VKPATPASPVALPAAGSIMTGLDTDVDVESLRRRVRAAMALAGTERVARLAAEAARGELEAQVRGSVSFELFCFSGWERADRGVDDCVVWE